ncbi:hypothetical protein BT96DRAFT_967950 [Gymnopus androsaceus JB14]|uniref:Exonuclease domain-containing protein n=1 Tax=Gymnopus androsaceus JB14 TaxID=1447944 RepID=A0A6A4GUX8_9AGAR|nr:hypothetical protein BT96DRAFT_967950 [Gymnopus androsaceus JB14]
MSSARLLHASPNSSDLARPTTLVIAVDEPKSPPSSVVPAKRTVNSSPIRASSSPGLASPSNEPPRKVQKLDPLQRRVPAKAVNTTVTPTGVPVLKVPAASSSVALPVRQAMLKTLYEHFVALYEQILSSHPNLAAEHALKQEQEVYATANKFTYRNAMIQSVAAIKRRVPPTSISHPSIGTEGDIVARAQAQKSISALRVTAAHLEPHITPVDVLKTWGYVVEIPPGPGGSQPSIQGKPIKCERCGELFVVRALEEKDSAKQECLHHWGRHYSRVANGERIRAYNCCSKDVSDKGCVQGPHVFYESEPETLHLRHAFSRLGASSSSSSSTSPSEHLDVAALDCEMIYTTGGLRIARVSVVDGFANPVFDELVRMDDGVQVLDFNTRFSGITAEMYAERAVLPLSSIRQTLSMVGHALENDLKTLRLVHHRCVDTVFLYPHPRGAPYRRSLRDLAREHLNTAIQEGGGSTGHSSLEDAIATLDLVRLYLINNSKAGPSSTPTSNHAPKKSSTTTHSASSSSTSRPAFGPRGSRPKVTPLSNFVP